VTTYLSPPGATSLDRATVAEAMHAGVGHLSVVDKCEHPIGVVSTLDVAAFVAGSRLPVERSSR
jgi:hypothetical protein